MKYAVLNNDNVVVNIIEYQSISKWAPPFNCYFIRSEEAQIGDIYNRETHSFKKGNYDN